MADESQREDVPSQDALQEVIQRSEALQTELQQNFIRWGAASERLRIPNRLRLAQELDIDARLRDLETSIGRHFEERFEALRAQVYWQIRSLDDRLRRRVTELVPQMREHVEVQMRLVEIRVTSRSEAGLLDSRATLSREIESRDERLDARIEEVRSESRQYTLENAREIETRLDERLRRLEEGLAKLERPAPKTKSG
jgi:hypothetical protein